MKLNLVIILLLLLSITSENIAQEISLKDKQRIISHLDSTDVFGAINTIIEYKISEAREKVEQVFWNSNFDKPDQLQLLDILFMFDSPLTESYALAYIDTLNNLPTDYTGIDPLFLKAMAAGILLKEGNSSKVQLIFDYIDEDSSNITFPTVTWLPYIIKNASEYEQRAKELLINILDNSDWDLERVTSLMSLYEIYGSEMKPLLINMFEEDGSPTNKKTVLDTLVANFKSEELHNLLKDRLVADTSSYIRYNIVKKLLDDFGTPADLMYVINYQPTEPHETARGIMLHSIQGFIPPRPDIFVFSMIDTLRSYAEQLYQYQWITDSKAYKAYLLLLKEQKNESDTLQAAKAYLSNINLLIARVQSDFSCETVTEDGSTTTGNLITEAGYKFMYYYSIYIKDNLRKIISGIK